MFSAIIKRIRHHAGSFRVNLILFYSILLCGSLLAAGAASSILFSHTIYEQAVSQVNAAAEQFENSMSIYFDDVSGYIKSFLADERVYKDVRDYSSLSGYEKHSAYSAVNAQIARVLNGNDNISDVIIYNDVLQLNCLRDSQGITAKFSSDFLQTIKNDIMSSPRFSIRFLVAQQDDYIYGGADERRLLVCFPLRDYHYSGGAPLAAVIFEYKLDRLEKMFHSFSFSEQCRSFLLDADNEVILGDLDEGEAIVPKEQALSLTWADGSQTLTRIDIPDTGWHLEYMIRTNIIRARINTQRFILLFILFVTILLSIFLSILLGNHLSRPFDRLQRVMEQLASGDLTARFHHPERYYSEFIAIGNGFNNMAEQLESLLDDMYEASLLQNQAELSAIRSKINPHFFYNALQTISSFAMLDDCDHVQQAVRLLGEQFEYVVYGEEELVPFEREISHICTYMEYQNLRHQHPIALDCTIPPELMEERIPKLIVQPIIENCVKHAFAPEDTDGHISITAQRQADALRISVSDNGCGISPERLTAIRESLRITRPDSHIGLSSIHNRLHLRWGRKYGLTIDSTLGRGTVCTLLIPILGKESNDENQNADR